MGPKPRFTDGEKVLCFHGPLLYEAKCLKSQIRDRHLKYFIHYSGWNKNWDEWVPESRVLKYNEANLQKQKELSKTHMKSKKSKNAKLPVKNKEIVKGKETPPKRSKPVPAKTKPSSSSKGIKRDLSPIPETSISAEENPSDAKKIKTEVCFMEEVEPEKEIKVNIPQLFLRNWLADDWDLITRQKRVLRLPARITVGHVIAGYIKEKVSAKCRLAKKDEKSIVSFAKAIRAFFNVALGKKLLWKTERPAYAEVLSQYPHSSMSEIYGAIHLLRMFSKMGSLLSNMTSEQKKAMESGLVQMEDFVGYMARNPEFFSISDYIVRAPEYYRRCL